MAVPTEPGNKGSGPRSKKPVLGRPPLDGSDEELKVWGRDFVEKAFDGEDAAEGD